MNQTESPKCSREWNVCVRVVLLRRRTAIFFQVTGGWGGSVASRRWKSDRRGTMFRNNTQYTSWKCWRWRLLTGREVGECGEQCSKEWESERVGEKGVCVYLIFFLQGIIDIEYDENFEDVLLKKFPEALVFFVYRWGKKKNCQCLLNQIFIFKCVYCKYASSLLNIENKIFEQFPSICRGEGDQCCRERVRGRLPKLHSRIACQQGALCQ